MRFGTDQDPVPPLNLLGDYGGGAMSWHSACCVHSSRRSAAGKPGDRRRDDRRCRPAHGASLSVSSPREAGRPGAVITLSAALRLVYDLRDIGRQTCCRRRDRGEVLARAAARLGIDPDTLPAREKREKLGQHPRRTDPDVPATYPSALDPGISWLGWVPDASPRVE